MKCFGLAAVLLLCVCLSIRIGAAANYIQIENAKPGTPDWSLNNPGYVSGAIEGYASLTSVNRGGQIQFFVNTTSPSYTMDIFRMGYYGGLGGRRMMPTITQTGIRQPACPMDSFGTVECIWGNPYALNIPNTSDPTDWMSGIYLVKLTASSTGQQQNIIFAVRDDARFTDLIMAHPVNTDQAYNPWGGKSLYGTIVGRADTANKAMKVSFNRPYFGEDNGSASFFYWEFGMIEQLEGEGYDISYATNVDVDTNPNLLISHKAFLSVGHDEYWSWRMRDNVEHARDAGINLGFFSGNVSYWQARLESSAVSGVPNRTLVGYKEFWQNDPITPDYLKTNEFRYSPVNRSEDQMTGVMYVTQARPAFCVEDASHWVFTGTGLKNGDCVTNPDGTAFLGYEVDSMIGPKSPANTQRMAHSPVDAKGSDYSDMTMYRAASGATVVATGSIGWSQSVPAIKQITRNVLARFITNAFADTTPIRPPLPTPFQSQDIGDTGRPGFVAQAGSDSFTINGAGQDSFNGKDAMYYVYQPLAGDGQIVARLNGLRLYWDNRAGVMIRESLAPDAKYLALMGRPSGSIGAVNEGVEFWSKDTVGANHKTLGAKDQNLPNWLKLARTGNVFTSYVSSDGVNWVLVGTVTEPMASNVYIGAEVQSSQYAVWATALFDKVSVSSVTAPPPPPPPPPTNDTTKPVVTSFDVQPRTTSTNFTINFSATDSGGSHLAHLELWRATFTGSSCTATNLSGCSWSQVTALAAPAVSDSWSGTITDSPPIGTYWYGIHVLDGAGNMGFELATIQANVVAVAPPPPPPPPPPGSGCASVALSKTSFYSGASESDWNVSVTAPVAGCTWLVTPDSSWIVVVSTVPAVPAGNGSFSLRTITNTTGLFRTGHFTIAGTVYVVKQEQ